MSAEIPMRALTCAHISFSIPGRIRGKGRPRFARRGTFVTTYTDAKTKSDEAMIRHFAAEAMQGYALMDGPVALCVQIFLQPPASWPKKKRAVAKYVTGKPDADNYAKQISDALNSIVWRDDSQVCDLRLSRRYSLTEHEHVRVTITAMGFAADNPMMGEGDWIQRRDFALRQKERAA